MWYPRSLRYVFCDLVHRSERLPCSLVAFSVQINWYGFTSSGYGECPYTCIRKHLLISRMIFNLRSIHLQGEAIRIRSQTNACGMWSITVRRWHFAVGLRFLQCTTNKAWNWAYSKAPYGYVGQIIYTYHLHFHVKNELSGCADLDFKAINVHVSDAQV